MVVTQGIGYLPKGSYSEYCRDNEGSFVLSLCDFIQLFLWICTTYNEAAALRWRSSMERYRQPIGQRTAYGPVVDGFA